jgi:hypothetical protein
MSTAGYRIQVKDFAQYDTHAKDDLHCNKLWTEAS